MGSDFFKQLETLPAQLGGDDAEASGIPTRYRKAVCKANRYRIADDRHHDWYRSRRVLKSLGSRRPSRDKDIRFSGYELCREFGKTIDFVLAPSPFNVDRLTFDIAQSANAFEKCV